MALIKCPECGKENISDSATTCPFCGYGIKEHFDLLIAENAVNIVKRFKSSMRMNCKESIKCIIHLSLRGLLRFLKELIGYLSLPAS